MKELKPIKGENQKQKTMNESNKEEIYSEIYDSAGYLVKTFSAWTTFEDLILNEFELKEYKNYAKEQQLLIEVSDYDI